MGGLVRRPEPHPRERRHDRPPRPGRRPGRAARPAPAGPRRRPAAGLGHLRRARPARCPISRASTDTVHRTNGDRHDRHPAHPGNETSPDGPERKTALVGGVLFYLITFVSIPDAGLYSVLKTDPVYVLGSGSDTGVLLGTVLELVVALAGIGTAVALFPVVRRQSESLALGFVATRIVEAALIFVGCRQPPRRS